MPPKRVMQVRFLLAGPFQCNKPSQDGFFIFEINRLLELYPMFAEVSGFNRFDWLLVFSK